LIPIIVIAIVIVVLTAAVLSLPSFGSVPNHTDIEQYRARDPFMRGPRFYYPEEWVRCAQDENLTMSNDSIYPEEELPVESPDFTPGTGLSVTWFGHSSVLLQAGGQNILVDPVFSRRCSPFSFIGPSRFSRPAVYPEDLPELDAVVITHDHYDHLDMASVKALRDKASFFAVPLGCEKHLIRWGIPAEKIHSFSWWEEHEQDGIDLACCPARHNSGRHVFDFNTTLFCSWAVKFRGHSIFIAGDGSYGIHFSMIGEKYGPFDLGVMECGQYAPNWRSSHMYPEESVVAACDIGAKEVLPVHWGTFALSSHAWNDSPERFLRAAREKGLTVITPAIGETSDSGRPERYMRRWWRRLRGRKKAASHST